jgi:hypothetical protein
MPRLRQLFLLFLAVAFVFTLAALAQDDAPSLGDVARQSRQQKQKDAQAKDAQAKDVPAKDTQSKDAPTKDAQSKDASAKDRDKDAAAKDAQLKTPHVITNDDLPEHIGPTSTRPGSQTPVVNYAPPDSNQPKPPPDYWKSQIMAMKNAIANLKANIESLSASIQYAGANCVSGCVEWNERQRQKQEQVEVMKAQLEEHQKQLEEMQEACRKQGYGSSVYDP